MPNCELAVGEVILRLSSFQKQEDNLNGQEERAEGRAVFLAGKMLVCCHFLWIGCFYLFGSGVVLCRAKTATNNSLHTLQT